MGLNSCSASTRRCNLLQRDVERLAPPPPSPRGCSAGTRAAGGPAAGSSPGRPAMARRMPVKSSRCIGQHLLQRGAAAGLALGAGSSAASPGCGAPRRTCAPCGRGRCPRRRRNAPARRPPAYRRWRAHPASERRPPIVISRSYSSGSARARPAGTAPSITSPVAAVERDHVAARHNVIATARRASATSEAPGGGSQSRARRNRSRSTCPCRGRPRPRARSSRRAR